MSTIRAWDGHVSSARSPLRHDERSGRLRGDYSQLDIDLGAAVDDSAASSRNDDQTAPAAAPAPEAANLQGPLPTFAFVQATRALEDAPSAPRPDLLSLLDTDEDGRISAAEFSAPPTAGSEARARIYRLFGTLDTPRAAPALSVVA